MNRLPKKGDAVSWNTSQGETQGHVERVVTKTTKIKGHVAKASKDHPEVVVKTDGSHKEAVHKADALHRK